jgi:hypothetical protein
LEGCGVYVYGVVKIDEKAGVGCREAEEDVGTGDVAMEDAFFEVECAVPFWTLGQLHTYKKASRELTDE